MIEPTDEMVQAWRDGMNAAAAEVVKGDAPLTQTGEIARAGVAAVLAIVERDYDVRERSAIPAFCGAVHPHAPYDCERPPGHSDQHLTFSGPVIAWH